MCILQTVLLDDSGKSGRLDVDVVATQTVLTINLPDHNGERVVSLELYEGKKRLRIYVDPETGDYIEEPIIIELTGDFAY